MNFKDYEIFDSHFHIIDTRFPLVSNQNYIPKFFTCEDYLKLTAPLNIVGGALVSASFQGYDYTFMFDALSKLGPSFIGVVQLPTDVTDSEIIRLNDRGIRGVRINIYRGGLTMLKNLDYFAKRIYELVGWHIELYLDSKDLPQLRSLLIKLPKISIDHLGMTQNGFPELLSLVEAGAMVKASGFGRVNLNIVQALKELTAVNPQGLIFGTDIPNTRARRPFELNDIKLIVDTLGDTIARSIFYNNAIHWYNPKKAI